MEKDCKGLKRGDFDREGGIFSKNSEVHSESDA